jgi:hypothetical protein
MTNQPDPFFEEISDTDYDEEEEQQNLIGLAIVKAHAFSQEYNPTTGRIEEKHGFLFLKKGYTEGFLAGFAYKFTGDPDL